MANYTLDTKESARADATAVAKSMANSLAVPATVGKLRFCSAPFNPDGNSVKADFVAAETVLGGYPAGGYPITDMSSALDAEGGGATITTPMIEVAFTIAPGDTLSAWWIEDSTGKVRKSGVLEPTRALLGLGAGFEFLRQFLYGRNT